MEILIADGRGPARFKGAQCALFPLPALPLHSYLRAGRVASQIHPREGQTPGGGFLWMPRFLLLSTSMHTAEKGVALNVG